MPESDLNVVARRITTVLGSLEIVLPRDAELQTDPGAAEGSAWYWSPQPGAVVLTISDGAADLRTAAAVLAMERSLDNATVTVLHDEADVGSGEYHLEFLSGPTPSRTFTADEGGHGHPVAGEGDPTTRARFRFWRRGGSAVRLGYRLDDAAAPQWRGLLDRIVDSARLG